MASEYDLREFEDENSLYKPFSPSSLPVGVVFCEAIKSYDFLALGGQT